MVLQYVGVYSSVGRNVEIELYLLAASQTKLNSLFLGEKHVTNVPPSPVFFEILLYRLHIELTSKHISPHCRGTKTLPSYIENGSHQGSCCCSSHPWGSHSVSLFVGVFCF